jgi:multidrug resistance protein MdtO
MTLTSSAPGISWERRLFGFLREELAPSPTRWRATLRITLLCALGTAFVMALHVPDGEFLIIFFFAVSQPDAWASFRRARLRGIGTLVGGALAILTILICGDKPWLFFVFQAALFAVGLFFSVTTTIPYAVIIALFTFVIATPLGQADPEGSIRTALWRILLTWIGVVFGTIGQMVLWPEKPEKLLWQELAAHMRRGEIIFEHLLTRCKGPALPARTPASNVSAAVVASQLDLLASAEAGNPQLRQHHAQQIKLITDVELIFGTVVRLERLINRQPFPILVIDSLRSRLEKIQSEMARLREALKRGEPPAMVTAFEDADSPANAATKIETLPVLAIVQRLERCLQQMPGSMAFLKIQKSDSTAGGNALDRIREPLGWGTILTPACSLSNVAAVQFSLKAALAGSFCYVLYQALDWPGISTCVVTALIVTQTSFGASVQKSLLRLVGALFGGFMALVVITLIMPNMETVASVVVVTSIPFFVAGWIVTGGSKISYVGMQVGLVLALVLLNRLGPTTNLAPAGDRILGVLIGIAVMGFINLSLWPNFAGQALHKKLADALRALAKISRNLAGNADGKFDQLTGNAHREIAAALTLYDDSLHEFGLRPAGTEADRQKSLAVVSRLEEVFLTLLSINRRRTDLNQCPVPDRWRQELQTLDEVIAGHLEMLADSSEKKPAAILPELDQSLANFTNPLIGLATLTETDAPTPGKLTEISVAYARLIEALKDLQADLKNAGLISI